MPYARPLAEDDDTAAEVDEPPDSVYFSKLVTPISDDFPSDQSSTASNHCRKASLLTQALLTSPELTPASDHDAPALTSDGGLTSPARTTSPSPRVSAMVDESFATVPWNVPSPSIPAQSQDARQSSRPEAPQQSQETKVEEGLGRRRCISFACGRQAPSQVKDGPATQGEKADKGHDTATMAPPKRPCILRFACPMKPSRKESPKAPKLGIHPTDHPDSSLPEKREDPDQKASELQCSDQSLKLAPYQSVSQDTSASSIPERTSLSKSFNRVNYQKSEATRFHEFAGPFNGDDEWTNEQTAYRQKLTIEDTLRKENAIRKLGQEAEEEGLDEDGEDEAIAYDSEDADDIKDEDFSLAGYSSNDGNESDDEGGFASSDDESDDDSGYQFWTPGLTTAATSTDHVEHVRALPHRNLSESSLESLKGHIKTEHKIPSSTSRAGGGSHTPHVKHGQSGTPGLPDSSDFVVGTIDEDRPLEVAYLSCIEQRKRSKQKLIPQDIDPSFPTSDPEPDDEDIEDEGEDTDTSGFDSEDVLDAKVSDKPKGMAEECTELSGEDSRAVFSTKISEEPPISPVTSPRRLHSPPPCRLFGQATHRLRSPPPLHRKLRSPPSSRRLSLTGSSMKNTTGIEMPRLAQRPNLTHTTSLPRTPNPFWGLARKSRLRSTDSPSAGTSPRTTSTGLVELHSRGPIDIVQGLENKKQRRKEKYWRQHCRMAHAGKEKERKCPQGKGAERMRELGLEVADRCRAYRPNLVLSV